jgi:hypothetical protein
LLSSDVDGEALSAARALNRTLKNAGLDIHVLADAIGEANSKKWGDDHVLEAYRRGVEDGKREAEGNQDVTFYNVTAHDEPSWHDIACECAKHPNRLYSDWLRKIYVRVQRWARFTDYPMHYSHTPASHGGYCGASLATRKAK